MIRNCVILGSGRSGTSLTAGVLSLSGYFMGDSLYAPDSGNPKGYFEDMEINGINEELLAPLVPRRPKGFVGDIFFRSRVPEMQRWLAVIPRNAVVQANGDVLSRIRYVTARVPFCFKDPRFSYTLPAWRPFIGDAVFICVFREPSATVESILRECRRDSNLHALRINATQANRVWETMYSYILDVHYPAGGDWIFLHYNQFLNGAAQDKLEQALGGRVDRSFADSNLKRSQPGPPLTALADELYSRLCQLAGCADRR